MIPLRVVKSRTLDRLDIVVSGAVFIAALALYLRTLATTLLLGDSGEFQTLASSLGLAHGTGYPVYILLTKVFTLLVPLHDIAYRVNLFSAVCAAFTLALVYLLARALGSWRLAALAGTAALAVCKLFWWHAVIAEVYDPAAAVIALVLLLTILWRRNGDPRLLFWAGLAGGLGLGIHYAVLLAAPAVLIYLALSTKAAARPRTAWLHAATGALLGLSIYAISFLALDLFNAPSTNFHAVMQPSVSVLDITPEQFNSRPGRIWYLASGKQFQGELFSLPPERVIENIGKYALFLSDQFPWLLLVLAGLGWVSLFAWSAESQPKRWREAILLLTTWLAMFLYIINYDIGDDFVFYIPGYVPLAVFASLGANRLMDLLERLVALAGNRISHRPVPFHLDKASTGLLGVIFVAAAIWPSIPIVQKSWQAQRITFLDASDYRDYPYPVLDPDYPHRAAKDIAGRVEDNAIIFTDWGMIYPIYYVTHVEQGRTGIAAHETYPAMKPKPFADSAMMYIEENIDQRPIYFMSRVDRVAQRYRFVRIPAPFELYRIEKRSR